MIIESKSKNKPHRTDRAIGFSLIEMVIVIAITIILSLVAVLSMVPLMNAQHVTNAYNTTLAAMRQARDNAISQRTSYQVTFTQTTTPVTSTITVAPTLAFTGSQRNITYQYPSDVSFIAPPSGTAGPDGFGSGATAVDFGYTSNSSSGAQTTIYFCPDGSAQTSSSCSGAGMWDGGVVYLGRTGQVLSERAISLYGGTGRLHGWRLYPNGSNYQWIRQ